MNQQSLGRVLWRGMLRLSRMMPLWLVCLLCITFCGVAGPLLLSHAPLLVNLSFSGPPEPTTVPAPTTPPSFGLNGQATCRNREPPTASSWLAVARADAEKYQIDVLAFEWQIWQESGFNPDAVSPAGAIGIAQFLPETAAGMGVDPRDPQQALDGAARLDGGHLNQYKGRAQNLAGHYGGGSAHYAYALALAAYNAGPGAVEGAWRRAFAVAWPDSPWEWLAQLGLETRHYVPNILGCL